MKQKKSVEDYLKTIYVLSGKKDVNGAADRKRDLRAAQYALSAFDGAGRG